MAGKHARMAPVLIWRAIATLVVSALLLGVGVAAMTVLTGREQPATGGREAGGPTVAPTPTTGATSGAGPGDDATSYAEPGGAVGGGSSAAGELVDRASTGGSGTTSAGVPSSSPGSGAGATAEPGFAPAVAAWSRGWAQRSDTGRVHGRALGLLRRLAAAHGCRPVTTKAQPITAQPEPMACP